MPLTSYDEGYASTTASLARFLATTGPEDIVTTTTKKRTFMDKLLLRQQHQGSSNSNNNNVHSNNNAAYRHHQHTNGYNQDNNFHSNYMNKRLPNPHPHGKPKKHIPLPVYMPPAGAATASLPHATSQHSTRTGTTTATTATTMTTLRSG